MITAQDPPADDHMRAVFAADLHHLATFVAEHVGDTAAIDELINTMASYRANTWFACMLEAYQGGEEAIAARIVAGPWESQ